MQTAELILNPLLCGAWDGANLWVQWDAPVTSHQSPVTYLLRVRLRPNASAPWDKWRVVGAANPFTRPWAVVQLLRSKWEAQVQVRVKSEADHAAGAADEALWQSAETATEVTFARATAPFLFENASPRDIDLPAGSTFDAMVDLAACSYRLDAPLTVPAQASATAGMLAVQTTAWHQIDEAGDFVSRGQVRGLTVTNTGPSEGDVTPTGRDFTLLTPVAPGGPGRVVATGRKWALPVNP
jgi:hypothetical protein